MGKSTPARNGSHHGKPLKDRRSRGGAGAPLQRLKGLLARPIGLERRDGKVQLVLKERRRAQGTAAHDADEATPSQLCTELSARLLAHETDHAVRTMRHLMFVHDVLDAKGWAGVAAMSGHVLTEALDQLELLAADDPSPQMDLLVARMRPLQRAAELRDERDARYGTDFSVGSDLVVSESNFTEFETVERDWSETVPAGIVRTGRADE